MINKAYNAEMLAAAICKLEGFTYAPSDARYWQQGKSTENDFIYVTTQSLTPEQLQALSDEVGEGRSLLVCCSVFRGNANRYPNLTIKKIPKMVLSRCQWGHDDYSLNVENLPQAPKPEATPQQAGLFEGDAREGGCVIQQTLMWHATTTAKRSLLLIVRMAARRAHGAPR